MAEVQPMGQGTKDKDLAEEAYLEAKELYTMMSNERIENGQDDKIEVLRLSINLNYAVFLYEMKQEKKKALQNLKKELQEALDDFEKWNAEENEQIKQQVELM